MMKCGFLKCGYYLLNNLGCKGPGKNESSIGRGADAFSFPNRLIYMIVSSYEEGHNVITSHKGYYID